MNGRLGAVYSEDGVCRFTVWAPLATRMEVHIVSPAERLIPLERQERGYHQVAVDGIKPGSLYFYRIDAAKERPDPASASQPQGVHGPSEILDPQYDWSEGGWSGLPLQSYVIYEMHTGTFTTEGTFEAVIPYLDGLKDLGITAIELMPVAQFPGSRNWGYDGVYPFSVQSSYGGPRALKQLVNSCHQRGLAVVLDVVYNHLGPEGNYFWDFGPYFTDRYKTPWGAAVNFDGEESDEVRRFFIENALYWIGDFHIDALRLDATHAMFDFSARPFLGELADAAQRHTRRLNRRAFLIAESNQNDVRIIRPRENAGYGLDAQWNDDFHHAIHAFLTGERDGYYEDYGEFAQLVKAFREGFVYSGEYSPFRKRRHGSSSSDVPGSKLIVFVQNHDQVGNRMLGERLSEKISFDEMKLAAGAVLLSPFIPLLFMGEEYGETAPFQYFVSHSDPGLIRAVHNGRREEFSSFAWHGEMPNPQSESTFLQCKLNHKLKDEIPHNVLYRFYRELIRFRGSLSDKGLLSKATMDVTALLKEMVFFVRYHDMENEIIAIYCFSKTQVSVVFPSPTKRWRKLLDSADSCWGGSGSPTPNLVSHSAGSHVPIGARALVVFAGQD